MSNRISPSKGKLQTKKLTRAQRRAQQRRKKQLQSIITVAIGAVVIVVAFIIATNTATPTGAAIVLAPPRDHPMAEANTMGDPNAPVVIEIFSDFQCSHCRNFYQSSEAYIIENYIATGKAYFIYHSFGDSQGGDSGRAAEAAYCAGDQNKFWEMHDIIYYNFSHSDQGGYSTSRLNEMADMIGLDKNTFTACLKGDKYGEQVDNDARMGLDKGFTGTPGFTINDELIRGNAPLEDFIQVIEAELTKAEE